MNENKREGLEQIVNLQITNGDISKSKLALLSPVSTFYSDL